MLKLGDINVRRFGLSDQFINQYKDKEVPWGPVGYITFKENICSSFEMNLTQMQPALKSGIKPAAV